MTLRPVPFPRSTLHLLIVFCGLLAWDCRAEDETPLRLLDEMIEHVSDELKHVPGQAEMNRLSRLLRNVYEIKRLWLEREVAAQFPDQTGPEYQAYQAALETWTRARARRVEEEWELNTGGTIAPAEAHSADIEMIQNRIEALTRSIAP